MQLPDFPPMSADTLEAIGERHNLRAGEISPLEDVGIFNSIYLVGSEYVLRVPRVAPPFVAAIRKESVAVPAALAAGVRTPALIAFDDSLDLLPVPYAIYERVHGICTEPREPRHSGATRISQPVTRYLCDFGQAC